MESIFLTMRYDYILIWGHGLEYVNKIRKEIREYSNFKIKKIIYHRPKSIKKLVNIIYSYDYAPLEHLKGKTKYLLTTPKEVVFIFIENINPDMDYLGEGSFRHEESVTLKKLKEEIRNKYNPRVNGKRSEDHIIHASDNELQTDYILKYLRFKAGVKIFYKKNKFLITPYYMDQIRKIRIRKVKVDNLICNIATGEDRYNFSIESVCLPQSPQYRGLTENILIYENYINKFLGGPLTADYFAEKLINLSNNLQYLQHNYLNNYIIVKKSYGKYLILDGLHRASILASRGLKEIVIGEIIK